MEPLIAWDVTPSGYFVELELDGAVMALSLDEAKALVTNTVAALMEIETHMKAQEEQDGNLSTS